MSAAQKLAQQRAQADLMQAERRAALDRRLRSHPDVAFAIIGAELGFPECLVAARARKLREIDREAGR